MLVVRDRSFALGHRRHGGGCRQQRTDDAVGQRPGRTDLLARSRDRRLHLVNIQTPQDQLTQHQRPGDHPDRQRRRQPGQQATAAPRRPLARSADRHARRGFALQHHAGHRHLRQRRGTRSRRRQRRGRAGRARDGTLPAARRHGLDQRPVEPRCIPPMPSSSPAWPCRSC